MSSLQTDKTRWGGWKRYVCQCDTANRQLVKDYERGDVTKIDWLDRMAFRQIEKVHSVSLCSELSQLPLLTARPRQASQISCISTLICRNSISR